MIKMYRVYAVKLHINQCPKFVQFCLSLSKTSQFLLVAPLSELLFIKKNEKEKEGKNRKTKTQDFFSAEKHWIFKSANLCLEALEMWEFQVEFYSKCCLGTVHG